MEWLLAMMMVAGGIACFAMRHRSRLRACADRIERSRLALLDEMVKRAALTNRLIDIARRYGDHELLMHVGLPRHGQPAPLPAMIDAATVRSLAGIRVVAERFPELMGDEAFILLVGELRTVEDGLRQAREALTTQVARRNRLRGRFPATLIPGQPGFQEDAGVATDGNGMEGLIHKLTAGRGTAASRAPEEPRAARNPPTEGRRARGFSGDRGG